MSLIANILIALIALEHVYILILEMFLWDKPTGLKTFGHTLETARQSKVLAANQGLYNGFLAAGLFWGLALGEQGKMIKLFFLICIFIAGVYGGITAKRKILYIQAMPAALALIAMAIAVLI